MAGAIPGQNLASFCRFLADRGELVRVSEPVDPYLEVTEIADRDGWRKIKQEGRVPTRRWSGEVIHAIDAQAGQVSKSASRTEGGCRFSRGRGVVRGVWVEGFGTLLADRAAD